MIGVGFIIFGVLGFTLGLINLSPAIGSIPAVKLLCGPKAAAPVILPIG